MKSLLVKNAFEIIISLTEGEYVKKNLRKKEERGVPTLIFQRGLNSYKIVI